MGYIQKRLNCKPTVEGVLFLGIDRSILHRFLRPSAAAVAGLALAATLGGCGGGGDNFNLNPPVATPTPVPTPVPGLAGTFAGPDKKVGNGTAHSFVVLNNLGVPTSIGMQFTESALSGLPAAPVTGTDFLLTSPPQAAASGFNDLTMDWNPLGHAPPGIYDKPHFDFHFYLLTHAQRALITPNAPNGDKAPPPGAAPPGYVDTHGIVPQMGVHWVDTTSPEFHGQPFTHTFIYGFFNGSMAFEEPMITLAFLQTHPNFTGPIRQPLIYPRPGLYPTSYSVKFDAATRTYTVSLNGLTMAFG